MAYDYLRCHSCGNICSKVPVDLSVLLCVAVCNNCANIAPKPKRLKAAKRILSTEQLKILRFDVRNTILSLNKEMFQQSELTKPLSGKWTAGEIKIGLEPLIGQGIIEKIKPIRLRGTEGRNRSPLFRIRNVMGLRITSI